MNLDLWKKRKKELKLTYDNISTLSGIPLTTVKYIFLGYVETPRIDTVQAIEKALGIKDTTFTDDDFSNGVFKTKKVSITADEEEMLDKIREVINVRGEKGKDLIIDFCNMLLEKYTK